MHPKGSGFYSAAVGLLFLGGVIASFFVSFAKPPIIVWLFRLWLIFVSGTLLYWGQNRVRTGKKDMTIGQDTISMVNGIFASTIALLALMFGK